MSQSKAGAAIAATSASSVAESIVRKPGATADVTITLRRVVRNEMRKKSDRIYAEGEKLPYNVNIYNPSTYNFVDDLKRNMTRAETSVFLATKVFEIVIDSYTLLNYRPGQKTVLDQLGLISAYINKIENVEIVIKAPIRSGIKKYNQYQDSSARAFLARVLIALGYFHVLKNLDIIIALPKAGNVISQMSSAWPYVFPFYELETFKNWKLKFREQNGNTELLFGGDLKSTNNLYNKHLPRRR